MTRRKPPHLATGVALSAVLLLAGATARAQTTDDARARADTLFREGQDLLSAGQFPTACAKLEESQRLDPKIGRLLNVAYCHEQLGRTATAWNEYNQAAALALQLKQTEREAFARKEANALAHKLSFVQLDMNAAPEVTQVTLDGVTLTRDQWTVPFPVDPGPHSMTFGAAGRKTQTQTVVVGAPGTMRVVLEPLGPEAGPNLPVAAPPPQPPSGQHDSGMQAETPAAAPHGSRLPGWIVGGVGVVALGVGAGFGVRAISLKSDADAQCPNHLCSRQGTSTIADAKTAATISTIGLIAGAVGVGVGAWLVLRVPSVSSSISARAQVVPLVAEDRVGLAWQEAW